MRHTILGEDRILDKWSGSFFCLEKKSRHTNEKMKTEEFKTGGSDTRTIRQKELFVNEFENTNSEGMTRCDNFYIKARHHRHFLKETEHSSTNLITVQGRCTGHPRYALLLRRKAKTQKGWSHSCCHLDRLRPRHKGNRPCWNIMNDRWSFIPKEVMSFVERNLIKKEEQGEEGKSNSCLIELSHQQGTAKGGVDIWLESRTYTKYVEVKLIDRYRSSRCPLPWSF